MYESYTPDNIIDGRYKVIAYHGYDGIAEHYRVVDIHNTWGQVYHLLWYHLDTTQIYNFETYRQLIRGLKRDQKAAVERIVARPASHYVVWRLPDTTNQKSYRLPPRIQEYLMEYGYNNHTLWLGEDAHGRVILYGLAFENSQAKLPNTPTNNKLYQFLWAWLPALLVMTMAIYLLLASLVTYIERPVLTLPNVIGQPISEAVAELHELGFEVTVTPKRVQDDEDITIHTVIHSVPASGHLVRRNTNVHLDYLEADTNSAQQRVPNLQGEWGEAHKILDVVEQRLQQHQLHLGDVSYVPASVAANTVLAQFPSAGTFIEQGSTVDVILSEAIETQQILMPDLRGLSLTEAREWIQLAGIYPPIMLEYRLDNTVPLETVLEQNIMPNRVITAHQGTLRLIVSEGSRISESQGGVPDFTGMNLPQARALAETQSIALSINHLNDRNLPEGVVLQNPAPYQATESLLAGVNIWVNDIRSFEAPLPPTSNPVSINPAPSNPLFNEVVKDIYLFTWRIGEVPNNNAIADVIATIPDGQQYVVYRERVQSNSVLSGSWQAPYGEGLRFELQIDGQPYGEAVLIEPR